MKMEWVPGRNGYDIPVRAAWAGEEQVVIMNIPKADIRIPIAFCFPFFTAFRPYSAMASAAVRQALWSRR